MWIDLIVDFSLETNLHPAGTEVEHGNEGCTVAASRGTGEWSVKVLIKKHIDIRHEIAMENGYLLCILHMWVMY